MKTLYLNTKACAVVPVKLPEDKDTPVGVKISTNYITNNGVGLRVQIRVSFGGNRHGGLIISTTFNSGSGVGYHARNPVFKRGINPHNNTKH